MTETEHGLKFHSVDDLAEFLRQDAGSMPRRLRECATYFLEHRDRIAVSTVADISTATGVQPSAIIRFCKYCGFSGFSELQRLYRQEHAVARPDYATRLVQMRLSGPRTSRRLLADFVEAGRASLGGLFEAVDMEAFDRASTLMAQAKMIHLVGFRRAFPVVSYLTYTLEKMGVPAFLHTGVGGIDQARAIRTGDVVLAVTFAPYSSETTEITAAARSMGVPVVTLTDMAAEFSAGPAAASPDVTLTVRDADVGDFRGLSATLTLATTLAVRVGQQRE